MIHLITGGARSGKSAYAESLALAHPGPVYYIATAEVRDAEFAQRVAQHKARRPAHWQLMEVGQALAEGIQTHDSTHSLLLVDCLGMWLMRFWGQDDQLDHQAFEIACQQLYACLAQVQGQVLLVTNEIGWGVMPDNALSRRFMDLQGRLNQQLAARCQYVSLVACGLPLVLKKPQ